MKPSKPNGPNEEQPANQTPPQSRSTQGPEPAAKRDVEEAERKAEHAEQQAGEAKRMAIEEAENIHQSLQEEIDALEKRVDALTDALEQVNTNVEATIDDTGAMSSPTRDSMAGYGVVEFEKIDGDEA